jgi:ADP-ribose pyrophosphatase YjhB (NUDIX family)
VDKLYRGVIAKRSELDEIITKAAPDWPLEKISVVDRNVLRIGLYELLFSDRSEVPAKVAINEAIELAKSFGGENSGKFVNGVLGAVYKEMGEPGKDEISKKKIKKEVPYEKMPIERLAGAVVFSDIDGEIKFALVHDIFGHWTLSKGHVEDKEKLEDGVVRIIKEEMGLSVKVKDQIGDNEYIASDPEKGKLRKQVSYFLAESPYKQVKLKETGGLDDCSWFSLKEVGDLNFYDDVMPIVIKAIEILKKTK